MELPRTFYSSFLFPYGIRGWNLVLLPRSHLSKFSTSSPKMDHFYFVSTRNLSLGPGSRLGSGLRVGTVALRGDTRHDSPPGVRDLAGVRARVIK